VQVGYSAPNRSRASSGSICSRDRAVWEQ
jgi:hypothetical protein